MKTQRILIVGGVAGGASCAARLRRLDGQTDIHLIDRGPYVSFANCGLPYFGSIAEWGSGGMWPRASCCNLAGPRGIFRAAGPVCEKPRSVQASDGSGRRISFSGF